MTRDQQNATTRYAHALVTGASSGIGAAIARRLAPHVERLTLVARRTDRLTLLANELTAADPQLIVTVAPCDLADEASIDALVADLPADAPVDALVNSAGFGDEDFFDQSDWTVQRRMVQVNVLATLQLTHRLLPAMVERDRGAILFVGSGAGHVAMPRAAVYAGTKHFIDGFVESLRLDLVDTAVTVTQLAPGPVATEFDAVAGIEAMTGAPPFAMGISADQCADEAVAALAEGRALAFPGQRFRWLMTVTELLPRPVTRAVRTRQARGLR